MFFILVFGFISVAVILHINTLQTEKKLCRVHLQSAISESQQILHEKLQLEKSYKRQLKLAKFLKSINQKLNEEKKDLRIEIKQINSGLKTLEDYNDALLEEKKELEKKINQTNAEFHSIDYKNKKLLVERKTLNKKLQSTEDDAKSLLKEKEGLQNKIARLEAKIQLAKQRSLEEKLESLKISDFDRDVRENQVWFIDKWMNFIEQLGEHIHAIIQYTEELQNSEVMVKGINLLLKFTKECRKFLDALSLHKIEKMKNLQDNTDMEGPKNEMEELKEFANSFKHQEVHQDRRTALVYDTHQETSAIAPVISIASMISTAYEVVTTVASIVGWGLSFFVS